MKKLGIKIWTRDVVKNRDFFNQAVKAAKDGTFEYIELFVFPNSYKETEAVIANEMKGCPVIIHNSHSAYGFDVGDKTALANNLRDVQDSQKFADMLGAEIIIVHAGCGDKPENLDETIRQFKIFNDERIAIENMPYLCNVSRKLLNGTFPEQIAAVQKAVGCKFCLDFSHAQCAANYYQRDFEETIRAFQALKPDMYHLCDGFRDEIYDKHLHFGEGNYDLAYLVNEIIAPDSYVTMETGYTPPVNIGPWVEDRNYFHRLEGE